MRLLAYIVGIVLVAASPLLAWGGEAHQAIALIAEERLSADAKAGIRDLLGADANISDAEIASWADQIKRERRDTAPLHYVNIPADSSGFDADRDGNNGANLIDAIGRFEAVLKDRTQPKESRAEALKFLVHLVGDLHQPLHCAERDGDKGGNLCRVYFLERARLTNLHTVWDTDLVRQYVGRTRIAEYSQALNESVTANDAKSWEGGTVKDWANETFWIAADKVYVGVPASEPPLRLDERYVDSQMPIVELQLRRGGIRLAALLNRALSTASTTKPTD